MHSFGIGRFCRLWTQAAIFASSLAAWAVPSYAENSNPASIVNRRMRQCEFYVDSFGLARRGLKEKWLEGEVVVDATLAQNGVPKVAAVVKYDTVDPQLPEALTIFAVKTNMGWVMMMPYNDKNPQDIDYRRIISVNVYVEYRNEKGIPQRVYLFDRNGLSPEDIFWDYPFQYIPRGSDAGVTYVGYPSPVMLAKAACTGEKDLLPLRRIGESIR